VGRGVSFQITILKVLAGHPEGRATLADLRRDVGILTSSGADWSQRMKRLAARAPDLDIFGQGFVIRDNAGWHLTAVGREFLQSIETRMPAIPVAPEPAISPVVVALPANRPRATFPVIGRNMRRRRRRREASSLTA
jgi:hypothetical protein